MTIQEIRDLAISIQHNYHDDPMFYATTHHLPYDIYKLVEAINQFEREMKNETEKNCEKKPKYTFDW